MDRPDDNRKPADADEPERTGDVLGLGGSTVPKTPGDPTASDDPESARQRRARAMGTEDDPHVERRDPYRPGKGATGIDMGAGGEGTDIEP